MVLVYAVVVFVCARVVFVYAGVVIVKCFLFLGHFVPASSQHRQVYIDFIQEFLSAVDTKVN